VQIVAENSVLVALPWLVQAASRLTLARRGRTIQLIGRLLAFSRRFPASYQGFRDTRGEPILPQSAVPTPVLKWLTLGLAALVAASGVTLAVFGMAHALGDISAAKWLWRTAIGLMMGLMIDLLLLVGALAIRQIESDTHS
jgi:hypothetical protein